MSRALLVLDSRFDREKATRWISQAPVGTRVEFKATKRTLDQNAKLWVLLTEVAQQADHNGRKYTADEWKILFMHAVGREVQFLPALDGKTFVPWGQSSSDLSKQEMSDLIEFIQAWGAEHDVRFKDDPPEHEPASDVMSPAEDAAGSGEVSPCVAAADLSQET